MAQIPTIKLAKPKNLRDFVVINEDDKKLRDHFAKEGYTQEVSQDENAVTPGAKEK